MKPVEDPTRVESQVTFKLPDIQLAWDPPGRGRVSVSYAMIGLSRNISYSVRLEEEIIKPGKVTWHGLTTGPMSSEINLICFVVAPPFPFMDRDDNSNSNSNSNSNRGRDRDRRKCQRQFDYVPSLGIYVRGTRTRHRKAPSYCVKCHFWGQ